MSCIPRITRKVLTALTLVALLAAPLGAAAAPAERRNPTPSTEDCGWPEFLSAQWRALVDLIANISGADGTEDPPPPPPEDEEEDEELIPTDPPTCPNGHSGGPCVDPEG
jgi:hypothetical protein